LYTRFLNQELKDQAELHQLDGFVFLAQGSPGRDHESLCSFVGSRGLPSGQPFYRPGNRHLNGHCWRQTEAARPIPGIVKAVMEEEDDEGIDPTNPFHAAKPQSKRMFCYDWAKGTSCLSPFNTL
jgi:hypothetical protein